MPNQQTQLTPTRTINLQSDFISFRDLPGSTRLFLDFVYDFDRVRPFLAPVEPRQDALIEFASILMDQKYPRDLLTDVLLEQNRRFGSSDAALVRIEQLREADTVAIVTGQQAGLFTGPIYTILKALTAVQVSRDLRAQGISAVPIFWIECEDHDQAEVNHTYVIDRDGEWTPVVYPIDLAETGKPIKNVVLTEAVSDTIDHLFNLLPPSEFVPDLERQIREAYVPGTTLAAAFGRLMAQWFQDFDLVLLDPSDVRLKRELGDEFGMLFGRTSEITRQLMTQSQLLVDAGYHAQLRITEDTVPFFIERNQKRVGLIRENEKFVLKSGDETFTLDQMMALISAQPEQFSPSVALRPLLQDTLLPTLAYIGGPSEIAYLSQLTPLAQGLGRSPTPILPRVSATLVERRYKKTLSAQKLRFQDLFAGFDGVIQSVVEKTLARQTVALFDQAQRSIEDDLAQIRQAVAEVDPTLGKASDTAKEKILYQLNNLRSRFTEAQARKEEETYRQIQRMLNVLYPDGGLQERQLNILHFLSRYGSTFLPQLAERLDVWRLDHHLIFIG